MINTNCRTNREKVQAGSLLKITQMEEVYLLRQRRCVKKDSGDIEGFHQPQQIASLQTKEPSGGGTISLGLCQGTDNHFTTVFIDALVVRDGRRAVVDFPLRRDNSWR